MLSVPKNFHLHPSHTKKAVFVLVQFAANQSFVVSDFKDFRSYTILLDLIITHSHPNKSFLVVVEVDSNNIGLKSVEHDFDPGDLPCWVEDVSERGLSANLTSLPIVERESECCDAMP